MPLELLSGDLLWITAHVAESPVYSIEVQSIRWLVFLRAVSRGIMQTVDRMVSSQMLVDTSVAFVNEQTKARRKLDTYIRALRLRIAQPSSLWHEMHPQSILELVADYPLTAKRAMCQILAGYASLRQFEQLGKFAKHVATIIVDGLLYAFGNSGGYNRHGQLFLLEWGGMWLGPEQKAVLLEAVSDHELLLYRVSEAIRVDVSKDSRRRLLPLSFCSRNSMSSFLKKYPV